MTSGGHQRSKQPVITGWKSVKSKYCENDINMGTIRLVMMRALRLRYENDLR